MNYIKISNEELIAWLKDNLNEKRYIHSIGTAECARELAIKFGVDEEKAYVAGLLHDCAKCFSYEESVEISDKYLSIDDEERNNHKTIHAPVGAYIAENKFGVTDKEMISSIRWHTLGRMDMSDFEKIIFIADKIELRTRTEAYADNIRKVLDEENGLNKAMLACYKETIKSLVNRNLRICTATVDIYNKLEEIVNVN